MERIDEPKLESQLEYRCDYLRGFIGFDAEDVAAIRKIIAQFGPRIPAIVDQTYEKLLQYDATARHFVSRQHGYDGSVPESLAALAADHPQIQFRKDHLQRYLMHLLGHSYDAKLAAYLDMIGKMHTPRAGNPEIDVPLVQMNALMGLVSDTLIKNILDLDVPEEDKRDAVRAFLKLLWIQNDFITKHYAGNSD